MFMKPDLSARLFSLQRQLNIRKKEDLARRLGCSRTMLFNYEKNDPPPPPTFLETLSLLERDAATGEHSTSFLVKTEQAASAAREGVHPDHERMRLVPVVGWAHAAEAMAAVDLPERWPERLVSACRDAAAVALRLEGDSMLPDYKPGDLLVVMPSEEAHSGSLVVVCFQTGGVQCRLLEISGEVITLAPINARYDVTRHTVAEFAWIFPVYGTWRQTWKS